jgi:RNA polymerase sigma factor (sigma-70 family)
MAFTTRHSVLTRIHDGDEVGWQEFYATYQPLVRLRGRDRGLRNGELDDLLQDVMLSVFRGQERLPHDPKRGRFRDYLRVIIDRRAIDLIRRRRPDVLQVDDAEALALPAPNDADAAWDKAWREHVLAQALASLKAECSERDFAIFQATAIAHKPVAEIAAEFAVKADNVYLIKHRLLTRLRAIATSWEEGDVLSKRS